MGNLSCVPEEVLSFHLLYLDHATLYALKYTAKFISKFLRDKIRINKRRAINSAISHDYYALYIYFAPKPCADPVSRCELAAETGSITILRHILLPVSIQCQWKICAAAARGGHMKILRYLRKIKYHWDSSA